MYVNITGWPKWLGQLLNKNFNVQNCVFFNKFLGVYIFHSILAKNLPNKLICYWKALNNTNNKEKMKNNEKKQNKMVKSLEYA